MDNMFTDLVGQKVRLTHHAANRDMIDENDGDNRAIIRGIYLTKDNQIAFIIALHLNHSIYSDIYPFQVKISYW